MKHGFIKVAAATCNISVADCGANATKIIETISAASSLGVKVLVFPALCVSGATCGDLFFSDTLLEGAKNAVCRIADSTKGSDTIIIIGFPFLVNDKIYNCVAFCQKGQILGVIPKSVIGNAEARFFSEYTQDMSYVKLGDKTAPFGRDLLFTCSSIASLKIGAEIGEEAYMSAPFASDATVVVNPAAVPETVGLDEYRRTMLCSASARSMCAYIHASAGDGESTTDGVYGGYCSVWENGKLLADRPAFSTEGELTVTEIDLGIISSQRRKSKPCGLAYKNCHEISFELDICETEITRNIPISPFIPEDATAIKDRCDTILTIQAKGLAARLTKAYAKTCVIGISGGLDSCLAILVAARTMDILGRPRADIIGVTMPCFGTTKRTKSNAELLCAHLGATLRCVNIGDAVRQHFSDIGHDESNHNVVFENSQARERTQVIMDIANMENGLVVGTGDLSELALGWATYNGDHMSMYGVNAGVPKTLIRHIVAFCADTSESDGNPQLAKVLRDILDTPVSPELLPTDSEGNIAQKTEDLVGPYEIHDFYIFYMLRYGFSPDKLYRLAKIAFNGKYSDETLLKWLKNLIRRFFAQQFKRSCLPDGPKIGTVGVSPRADLSMPSDASSAEWLRAIDEIK